MANNEKIGAMAGLLKFYQQEIDSLTSRAKFAEQNYLDVYKHLATIPDHNVALSNFKDLYSHFNTLKSSGNIANVEKERQETNSKMAELEEANQGLKEQLTKKEIDAQKAISTLKQAHQAQIDALGLKLEEKDGLLAMNTNQIEDMKQVNEFQQNQINQNDQKLRMVSSQAIKSNNKSAICKPRSWKLICCTAK